MPQYSHCSGDTRLSWALGWGAGRGAQAGVRGRAGTRRQAAAVRGRSGHVGVRGRRGAGELGVRGRRGAGALGVSGRRSVGARGAGRGRAGRAAWAWPGRWMGAQAGPAGPVLVHCAPGSVLARFLDPVRLGIFLSHQMNTVHCKIKFFSKNKLIFIKFKLKQIKSNKF